MRNRKVFGITNLILVAVFSICIAFISPAWAENPDLKVKVMTRNMYPGADLAVLAAANGESEFENAVIATMQKVLQSQIPERAAMLAAEIAETKPDLIALQEATTWKIETESGTIVLDQLDLLLNSLQAIGLHYKKAVVQKLTDVEVPGAIAYTDHDAILVRSDLPPGHLMILGSEKHIYDVLMGFPVLGKKITVFREWMGVDVKIRGARFKFVNTHLEAPLPNVPETKDLQFAQAAQLVEDLKATHLPIILAGDFNSDAEPTEKYDPDVTPSYDYLVASGYIDAWHELHPTDHGYTWPLLVETGEEVFPIERIDLIFSNGPEPISIARTGVEPLDGLFASDHVGVAAEFSLTNHRPDKTKDQQRPNSKGK